MHIIKSNLFRNEKPIILFLGLDVLEDLGVKVLQ